jgi:phosphotriesterase-related protein
MIEKELRRFKAAGGSVVVEFTPLDYHRNPQILIQLSNATGVHIIMGTGFYRSPGADYYLNNKDLQAVKQQLIDEVRLGEERTGVRAAFYKWATSRDTVTDMEYVTLSLITDAHKETKAPIATHCQRGRLAMTQVRLLKEKKVDPENIIIGHLDMILDLTMDILLEVLESGVSISFDQLGKPKYGIGAHKIELIRKLCELGFENKILCGTDIGRFSCLEETKGVPGYAYIPGKFRKQLKAANFSDELILTLLAKNPAKFYRSRTESHIEPQPQLEEGGSKP